MGLEWGRLEGWYRDKAEKAGGGFVKKANLGASSSQEICKLDPRLQMVFHPFFKIVNDNSPKIIKNKLRSIQLTTGSFVFDGDVLLLLFAAELSQFTFTGKRHSVRWADRSICVRIGQRSVQRRCSAQRSRWTDRRVAQRSGRCARWTFTCDPFHAVHEGQ